MANTKVQTTGKPSLGDSMKVEREAMERRREELLERIRNVDSKLLQELSVSIGEPKMASASESFHKYVFGPGENFTEIWQKAAEMRKR